MKPIDIKQITARDHYGEPTATRDFPRDGWVSWNAMDVQYSPIWLVRPNSIHIKKDGECVIFDWVKPDDWSGRERKVKVNPVK